MIKPQVREIMGKTIRGIIIKKSDRAPKMLVFLMFSDSTYYEFYGSSDILFTSGIVKGSREDVINYLSDITTVEYEAWEPKIECSYKPHENDSISQIKDIIPTERAHEISAAKRDDHNHDLIRDTKSTKAANPTKQTSGYVDHHETFLAAMNALPSWKETNYDDKKSSRNLHLAVILVLICMFLYILHDAIERHKLEEEYMQLQE